MDGGGGATTSTPAASSVGNAGDSRKERMVAEQCSSSASGGAAYRLFDRHRTIHQIAGGGKAADVILWKKKKISIGVVIISSVAWLLFERSGLSFLTIASDILMILVALQFLRANVATFLNKQLQPLPELVLSEEMVNNAAASLRVKLNNMLLTAHDITLGKDFVMFFKVAIFLWLFSVVGGFYSFFTLAYIGTLVMITFPALYNKYEDRVDKYAGIIHQEFSKHYKVVDENFHRLPRQFSKHKTT